MWEIEFTDEFGAWWNLLSEQEQESIAASVELLRQLGPHLGRPHVDAIQGSHQATGLTQEEVAASLGIKQPTLSRIESQDDIQVSTLQRLVRALGGELEIIAHLPGRDVRIRQFKESA